MHLKHQYEKFFTNSCKYIKNIKKYFDKLDTNYKYYKGNKIQRIYRKNVLSR